MWWKFPWSRFVAGCFKYLSPFLVPCTLQDLYECMLPTAMPTAFLAKQNFVELIFSLSASNGHTCMGVYDLCQGIDPCLGPTSCSVVEFYSWSSPEDPELLLFRYNRECVLSLLHGAGHRIERQRLYAVYCCQFGVLTERQNGAAIRG